MRLWVYRLRERGQRLPGVEVERRGPVEGEFIFRPNRMRTRTFTASLVRPGDLENFYVIPTLDEAAILKIENGMLLVGREFVSTGVRKHQNHEYRQTWWCVVPPSEQPALGLQQDALTGVQI